MAKNEFVNGTCLDGLEILKEHNLVFLATPAFDIFADHSCGNGELVETSFEINEESKETYSSIELVSSWSDRIRFDEDGFVISLDLGGRRLYKGLPFDPALFGPDYFPRLATLNLAGTDLPLKDILKIFPHIESTIECMYLGGNGLGAKGARAIANSGLFQPETPSKLYKLDLRYNDIGDAGIEALCTVWMNKKDTNVLQYLYLEGNSIGDEGCEALSAFLSSQRTMVDDESAKKNCRGIQEIYLGANKIGPMGAESIASVLGVNKRISKIYLEGNALGAKGATAFCKVLEELNGDTGLKHLYVDNNNIGKELSNRLAKA
eukprot:CAMPEP_0116102162 /NCGR_PEP_ID=MMETSP0327-20121206/13199_1 /TAXON_ID=44447 /ORGANISM="Pseudo-nitzschia delicatissima, Strain B596" /LENGTH=319 /DNA_ID=CAMNT_0003594177 /DNA_START=54 /DNA_END=1009 /DNA_ORIENTATION=+